ncbi:ABC transporter substrate-binding protein [Asticcacaulis biprosthecium]|uniref:ABC transporter substrate-binding protein n=1 Tax=Asticcacaulis biprosthecium TaxID=76891 RepID=UPI0012F49FA9|nr:extracellular solute-binding protein [Asticcacaulis biprosthecium]
MALIGLTLMSCQPKSDVTEVTVQRIFGECRANVPQGQAPIKNPDGECEVVTHLLDEFQKANPDIKLKVNIAPWPGYDQLSAQFASGDPPDIATMHMSAMPDFASRGLIEPLDGGFKEVSLDVDNFTPAARNGVTIDGQVYGMPFDNWTQLWHVNMNLFAKAGLVRDGQPILPRNPDELLAQARQFKAKTGLPYLLQPTDNERAAFTRNLFTYLLDQKAVVFSDPKTIRLNTPEARRIVNLFKQIYAEGLMAPGQDYPAAMAAFLNGEGGICLVGTWMIGTFEAEANTAGRPLYQGYTVKPYPMLYGTEQAAFVDGHAWVMPKRDRTPAERAAVLKLMKFLQVHDYDWARTGHLPTQKDVAQSAQYLSLPHRNDIVALASTGKTLPAGVERQFAIQDIVGDEMASAIRGHKSVDAALSDAEHRVNDLLFHVLSRQDR